MKDFSQTLADYLAETMEVSAMIGSGDYSRIFDHIARQKVCYPLLVVDESGGVSSEYLDGTTGNARGDYILHAFSVTVPEATDLWERIRVNLQTYGPDWMEEHWVSGAHLIQGYRDRGYFDPQDGSQDMIYHSSSVYSIWHSVPLEVV